MFAYYLDLNVLVFIVLLIAADATRQAGSTDVGLLVTALEQTNLEVAGRTVTFDLQPGSYRHQHWQSPVLIVPRQDGKETVVYPRQLATGALMR